MLNPVPECCLAVPVEPPDDRLDPGFELFFELRALDRREEFLFEFLVTIESIGASERPLDLADRLVEATVVSVSSAFDDLYSGGRISFGIVILPISGVFSPSFRIDLSVLGGSDRVRLVKADLQRRVFRGKRILS